MKHVGVQSSMAPASFVGPVVYNEQDKFKKVDFSEIDKEAADPSRKPAYTRATDNGWIGMIEHYFVAAWLPAETPKLPRQFYTTKLDNGLYTAGVRYAEPTIPPGGNGVIRARLYIGPQDQDVLAKLAPGLDLVVDYGIFTIIAAPLFWLLKWLHGLIGNWGWAIIVMTIMRVLKWIFDRCAGRANATETPLGFVPRFDDLDWSGFDFGVRRFSNVMAVDLALWERELGSHDRFFERLGAKRPDALMNERDRLAGRIAM